MLTAILFPPSVDRQDLEGQGPLGVLAGCISVDCLALGSIEDLLAFLREVNVCASDVAQRDLIELDELLPNYLRKDSWRHGLVLSHQLDNIECFVAHPGWHALLIGLLPVKPGRFFTFWESSAHAPDCTRSEPEILGLFEAQRAHAAVGMSGSKHVPSIRHSTVFQKICHTSTHCLGICVEA